MRRFSEAISGGDGISVIVEVVDAEAARAAEARGAEGILVRQPLAGVRESTSLPILWAGEGLPGAASEAGADALVLVYERGGNGDDERFAALHEEAAALGLDCVVAVADEEELEDVLELIDPEILLLSGRADDEHDDPFERALDLLPDVPAGKLAIARAEATTPDAIVALERAGVDAVIVGADAAGSAGSSATEI